MTPPITSRPGIPASQNNPIEQNQAAPIQDSGQLPKESGSEGVGDMSMSSVLPSEYNDFNMWLPLGYAQSTNQDLFTWAQANKSTLPGVDWAKKPTPFGGLEGKTVLVVYNPGSQGGRLARLEDSIRSTFSSENTGAKYVEFMATHPNQAENEIVINSKVLSLKEQYSRPVTVVVIGGDGGVGGVFSGLYDLESRNRGNVDGFIVSREGTAADIGTALGAPKPWYATARKYYYRYLLAGKDAPGNFIDIPKWSAATLVADTRAPQYQVELVGVESDYVRQNFPDRVAHGTTLGAIEGSFRIEEEHRKANQAAATAVLNEARDKLAQLRNNGADQGKINAQIARVRKAEVQFRLAHNKSLLGFAVGVPTVLKGYIENVLPKFMIDSLAGPALVSVQDSIRERFDIGNKAFDVNLDITRSDGSTERVSTRVADVLVTNVARNADLINCPGANPTIRGGVGIFLIPSSFPTVLVGFLEAVSLDFFGDGTQEGFRFFPKENYILLKDGDTVEIKPKGVPQFLTVNGDPIRGSVQSLKIEVKPPIVPTVMSASSVTAQKLDGMVKSRWARWSTQRNAAEVLARYSDDQALAFIPEVDRSQFFPNNEVTPSRLEAYFDSPQGKRTVAISPELVSLVKDHSYFDVTTMKSVGRHMGRSMGAGLAIGLIAHDLLDNTEFSDSYLARSAVNIGAMLVPDMLLNPGMLSAMVAGPSAFLKGMLINVGVGTFGAGVAREMAVVAGVERDSFKFHAASLVGATTTTLAMAYDTTRKLQLAATVAAAQATTAAATAVSAGAATAATAATAAGASVSVEAVAAGAVHVAGAARVLKLSPFILGAGLASDAVNAYAERNWRNQKETGLRANARKIYLDQNVEDAFGSHDDMTRRAAGLAQFVGVNLVAQALSPSLVDYGQDLSDYLTDTSTRDRLRNQSPLAQVAG